MANSSLRTAVASIAGFVVSAIVVFAVEGVGHALFPPPPGLDLANPQDQARLIAAVPGEAKVMVVVAWFLGALAGSTTAMVIARKASAGWIVAGVMVVLSVWTTQMFPHPAWMAVCAVVLPLAGAWLARRLVAARLERQALARR